MVRAVLALVSVMLASQALLAKIVTVSTFVTDVKFAEAPQSAVKVRLSEPLPPVIVVY